MLAGITDRVLQIEGYLDSCRFEMLETLRQLVEIESPSDDPEGVNRVGDLLAEPLKGLGFAVRRLPQSNYGAHLLADRDAPGMKRVLFYGHMDTVFPTGKSWPYIIKDGRAYGPGVSDMKGGLISLIYAFKALAITGGIPISARVLFNSEEEIGSPTSMPLIPELVQHVDYGCVLEPAEPDGSLILHRKGIGKFAITIRGKSSHAGQQPELGINANRELAYQILAAEGLADPAKGTTVNAGKIEGGTAPYIISDWAQAQVDVRVCDQAEQARMLAAMKRLEHGNQVQGTCIEVTGGFHRPPMLEIPGSEKLVEAMQLAAGYCRQKVLFGGGGAASDGNNLAAAGIPVIDGLGPVGGRAHSSDEYMEVQSFFDRTTLLATFLIVLGSEE
jgi:glutamate carboxypeptidase